MKRAPLAWLVGGGLLAYLLYSQRRPVAQEIQTGVEEVTAAVQGWPSVNQGPVWVPVLRQAEAQWGIPDYLLARIAYQESRFRQAVIDGTVASSAGALGLMQLEPQYFQTVRVPLPFTDHDTAAQIQEAAQELVRLYHVFGDWGLAVAAYNDGQANVNKYLAGSRSLPAETVSYLSSVFGDVPVPGATVPA